MKRKMMWIIPVLLMLAVGCATLQTALDTPQKRSAFFMGYYLQQRASYEAGVKQMPTLPAGEQRDVLKRTLVIKKRFLEEFGPAAKVYDQAVLQGKVPTVEMEQALWNLYTRLQEDLR